MDCFERRFTGIESLDMITASEIRDLIGKFIASEYSFDEFENRFVQRSWNIHRFGNIESQSLAYSIELSIAEYHQSALSYGDLRSQLQSLANTFLTYPHGPHIGTASTTSSESINVQWPVPVDKLRATASLSPVPH